MNKPPSFTFTATDRLAVKVLADYRRLCLAHELREYADQVVWPVIDEFAKWQAVHPELVTLPAEELMTADG